MTATHQHSDACQSHINQDTCFQPQPSDVGVPATWNDSHPGDVGIHAKSEPGHPAHLERHKPRGEMRFQLFSG